MISDPAELLKLCGSFQDDSAAVIQCKISKYLQKHTKAEKALLLVVSDDQYDATCQVANDVILEEEIKFPLQKNNFFTTFPKSKSLRCQDIKEEILQKLQKLLKIKIKSLLCIPIAHPNNEKKYILLVCLINKIGSEEFTDEDEKIISECCMHTSPILLKSLIYEEEKRQRKQCQSLLLVARNIFSHLDNVTALLSEIMTEARNLTNAERCSLFLLDKEQNELIAKVFDSNMADDGGESKDVRLPAHQGIAGHVATTGEMLNIHDAYSHPLFYRKMDEVTGFKTRNILCFPIQDDSGVVGVAELCNKKDGRYFTHFDEEIANAFSIYCAISIMHSLMWKKVRDAQHRSRLANELMMYHMKIPEEEVIALAQASIPLPSEIHKDFVTFSYNPRQTPDSDTALITLAMFEDLGMIQHWRIPKLTLARFILMVKKGYRDLPYHNWMHAFSVAHFCYLLLKITNLQETHLMALECFTLFVACICHDLDHRGTTNSFQHRLKTDLGAVYSSESSVMEMHHFSQTMAILHSDGCNIFENLSQKEYTQCLDYLQLLILATDLANHFRRVKEIHKILEDGYDYKNEQHHILLLNLLITSCDLSDQTKDWKMCKTIAERIFQEFFLQGDMEKSIGVNPVEMMDRERACIPDLQINFLNGICFPLYKLLSSFFPQTYEIVQMIGTNIKCWECLKSLMGDQLGTVKSLEVFDNKDLEDEVQKYVEDIKQE
ncbi:cGMP-dependent 3',5'-cyclic phosphodiesterase-like isoform X2 [Centruroides vittatus]